SCREDIDVSQMLSELIESGSYWFITQPEPHSKLGSAPSPSAPERAAADEEEEEEEEEQNEESESTQAHILLQRCNFGSRKLLDLCVSSYGQDFFGQPSDQNSEAQVSSIHILHSTFRPSAILS